MDNLNITPITYMMCVYNEENRIRYVLDHAVKWADEVVIHNKQSTDNTKKICQEYGSKVKVIDIPFTMAGEEDNISLVNNAKNDWVFFSTASEVPTAKLIEKVKELLLKTNGELDLIVVPRKMYSFGIHSSKSPWYIGKYPFLVNKTKAKISNKIHQNFKPSDPENVGEIEYAEDCCVYHLTHTSAESYLKMMTQYFSSEIKGDINGEEIIKECFSNIRNSEKDLINGGPELFGHYCAWQIYWLGTALFAWEKIRGLDVKKEYDNIRRDLLNKDWDTNYSIDYDVNKVKDLKEELKSFHVPPKGVFEKILALIKNKFIRKL